MCTFKLLRADRVIAFWRALLLAPVLTGLIGAAVVPPAGGTPGEVAEKFDDGSVKARYRNDIQGRKSGAFEEFFPGGKAVRVKGNYTAGMKSGTWLTRDEQGHVLETATYKNDKLDGPFSRAFSNGHPRMKTTYHAGELSSPVSISDDKGRAVRRVSYPRSLAMVLKAWSLYYAPDSEAGMMAEEPGLAPPYKAGKLSKGAIDAALARVRLYRALSGVPFENLNADPPMCDVSAHGAVVLTKIGSLTHTPSKPGDMDDAFFKLAYQGCNRANLSQGVRTPIQAIDGQMDDSDPSNIEKVGHRSWLLHPNLQRIGFGYAASFCSVDVIDGLAKGADYNFIAFPGEGYYPRTLIQSHYGWSVVLNPNKVRVGSANSIKVTMLTLDENFEESGTIPVKVVSTIPGSETSLIVFKPDFKSIEAGRVWVSIDGLKSPKGDSAAFNYLVDFIDPPPPAAKEKVAEKK